MTTPELGDEVYRSHQVLKGRQIIDADGEDTVGEFNALLKEKAKVKSRLTSMKTSTDNDLNRAEINSADKSSLHNTMVKSLLDMKQEMLAEEKIELDRIFTDLIAVIEACYTGPYEGSQWEKMEKFKDTFHNE